MNHFYVSNSDTVTTPSLFTPWSFVHFICGCYLYSFGEYFTNKVSYNFLIGILIHTIYELNSIHILYSNNKISTWDNNSIQNSIGDTISFILGFFLIHAGKLNTNYKHFILLIYYIVFYYLFKFGFFKNLD